MAQDIRQRREKLRDAIRREIIAFTQDTGVEVNNLNVNGGRVVQEENDDEPRYNGVIRIGLSIPDDV